jgi:hypothetical protein
MRLSTQNQQAAQSAIGSAIILLAANARVRGNMIELTKEATRLIADHPDSGWDLEEVIARIASHASRVGVPVEL